MVSALPWLEPDKAGETDQLKLAQQRHKDFLKSDPFPNIPRSLLAREHIEAYARETAMIFPAWGIPRKDFPGEKGALKTASYETMPGEKIFRFDEKGQLIREDQKSTKQGFIELPPNSITFVNTKDRFFLPNYIALRFNLRIKHVHRGLLLGTGPLVDPGYNMEILIPIHNLTDSSYFISKNEGLIWIEFTKTSAMREGEQDSIPPDQLAINVGLPDNTKKELVDYLFKANGGLPIRSSIPTAVIEARKSAKSAEKKVNTIQAIGVIALVSLTIGLISVFLAIITMINNTNALISNVNERVKNIETKH